MFSTLAFYDDDNDGSQTELIINKANARVISIHWSNDSDRQAPKDMHTIQPFLFLFLFLSVLHFVKAL